MENEKLKIKMKKKLIESCFAMVKWQIQFFFSFNFLFFIFHFLFFFSFVIFFLRCTFKYLSTN